ncbi:hypothetical protein EXM65_09010 [Clostridium botulinum]|uniref:Uncharacterized protein n=1 Tax=Clostridium botulinum TaxID=1491 RepID=A0A6M0SP20_CLOBO|nr:hypothetical protein [Clostridium botulinum]
MAGVPNKYDTHVKPRLFEIENWCREGLIEEEICKRLGVSLSSLQNYKNKYSELSKALKDGKEIADYKVENALYKRALGYKYKEVTKERELNKESGKYELVVTKEIEKEIAPDPQSIIWWLKNRKPTKWKDKIDINVDGSIDINNKFSYMTDEEIEKEARKLEEILDASRSITEK